MYILWFPCVYVCGIYVDKHLKNIMDNKYINLMFVILIYSVLIFIDKGLELISIMNLVCAIFTLLYFNTLKIKQNKTINQIAQYTLGIYAIHDNVYIRKYIIKGALHIKEMYYTSYFSIYTIIIAILIYAVSLAIDGIREQIFKRMMFKSKKMNSIYNKINQKIAKINDL